MRGQPPCRHPQPGTLAGESLTVKQFQSATEPLESFPVCRLSIHSEPRPSVRELGYSTKLYLRFAKLKLTAPVAEQSIPNLQR